MNSDTIAILNAAIKKNGKETELNVCMEECAELIQSISKCRRYGWKTTLIQRSFNTRVSVKI